MDYDVMSDQEWEPEAEDGEDIMVRQVSALKPNIWTSPTGDSAPYTTLSTSAHDTVQA